MKRNITVYFTSGVVKDFGPCTSVIATETDITFLDATGTGWHFKVNNIAGVGIKDLP
jgi:hypothetical protein